ncbi:MAG: hypothetical protein O3B21_10960 [Proteobacteria bacterium]|nr:hypothetical protein [Pseudomonadota bacterium]MDA1357577.1 hypothetical protein [Pseudomonadota bacterium]
MSDPEFGIQLVEALEKKIETRFRRQTRKEAKAVEPGLVLGALVKLEEQELLAQENAYRSNGNEDTANAFMMVRTELLHSVVRDLYNRLT